MSSFDHTATHFLSPVYVQGIPVLSSSLSTLTAGDVWFVDRNNGTDSNQGTSLDEPFKTLKHAVENKVGDGDMIILAPGFYIEESPITIANKDLKILGMFPGKEVTTIFGSDSSTGVGTAADDLFVISTSGKGRVYMANMSMYNHLAASNCILLDAGTSGGYTGGFSTFENIHFSPQAQDGFGYCVEIKGGSSNIFRGCTFAAAATAGVRFTSSASHNPSRNTVEYSEFRGTTVGVNIEAACYNFLSRNNIYWAGSLSGEAMANTKGIVATAGFNAGTIISVDDRFGNADGYDNGGTGTMTASNPQYGATVT